MAGTAEKLTLDLAQTVVIGRFNPYIVTPAWLTNHGIITDAEGGPDDVDEFPEDDTLFVAGGYEWEVSLRRMAVTAVQTLRDCGEKAAAVIDKLPHTPVDAVGNNFIFVCSASAWADRPTPQLGPDQLPAGVTESRWAGQFAQADANVELDLLYVPNKVVVLRLNYDRRVDGLQQVKAAVGQFSADYRKAGELIQRLFRIDVP